MNIVELPARTIPPDLIARFAAIVGDRYAVTDPAEIAPYLTEERGLYHGRSPLVLRPGSVAEVAAILKLANATRTPIVPQGGNTGLVGGQTPHQGEVLMSLRRLDRIREVDPTSNTMTCEAGVVLIKAQEATGAAARLFPISLGAQGSCTIGGNLSTNAGGTVTGFELIPRIALEFAVKHAPMCRDPLAGAHAWYVLLELSSQARDGLRVQMEEILSAGAERSLLEDATIAASLEQTNAFWLLRHHIADTQK